MKKWLRIGAALLLVAWAPFIYAELTSSPAEKKPRELPSVEHEEAIEPEPVAGGAVVAEPGEKPAAEPAADEAQGEPAAEDEPPPHANAPPVPEPPPDEPAPEPGAPDPGEPIEPAPDEEVAAQGEDGQEEAAPPPVLSGPAPQLKQAFETEPRDALWATDTERKIAAAWSGDGMPEGMLQKVSCRRAVCRLDVRWTRDNAPQYVGAYEALREQFGGGEIGVQPEGVVDEHGQQLVHLYVLRKGYTTADLAH